MAKNLGFARRLGEKLREMGYWPEGRSRANYTKFGVENGFVPSAVYRWLHGEIPRADTFYQLCLATKEQAHWYLLGRRVPEPTPGMSIPEYITVLAKDARAHEKKEKKRKRRVRVSIIAGLVGLGGLAPTPSAASPTTTPTVVQVLDNMLLIRLRLRRLLAAWARPLLPLGCPA